ncbi:MAG: DUF2723 domain-containing protein [Chloroflexi bacterium]|nr:DUF2723 domain-containing protein [Chloroflexota bacterium]
MTRRISLNTLSAILVFVAAAAIYIRTAAPTLGGSFDSEEFQYVAYTLGIAHATGYPLYLLLGKIFITLAPFGNVAYRMNLFTALLGAGAATLIYLIALKLTARRAASIATAALFATSAAVWRQSGAASVGPLTMLFMGAVVYAMLLWYERRVSLAFVAFVFGLALTHHHSILLFLPGIVLFILLVDFNILRRPREWIRTFVWFAIPLFMYLYVPLRGSLSEWYDNTLESFASEVLGTDAGDFVRTSQVELLQASATLINYISASVTAIGSLVMLIGAVSVFPRLNRWRTDLQDSKVALFFALSTCFFVGIGLLYGGEPDRYLALPFFFIVFWFGIGAAFLQNLAASRPAPRARLVAQLTIALLAALPIVFTVRDNFRYADWSAYDRIYKQWDEIFTLPIPPSATLVGNWGQINAMRYLQRVENRRADLQVVGTLYDAAPQTQAARDALADGRAIFLAPSIPLPNGTFRYSVLGSLLQVRDAADMQILPPSRAEKNIRVSDALTLAHYDLSVALEPYAPGASVLLQPNRTVRVNALWRAEARGRDVTIRLQLLDPAARIVAQNDFSTVRGLEPASRWDRGEYVSDVYNFLIPGGSPPGNYSLYLTVLDTAKTPLGERLNIGNLNVERVTTLSREQIFIQHPLDATINSQLALWGYGAPDQVAAGEALQFNLLWAVLDKPNPDLELNLTLEDSAGNTVVDSRRQFVAFYPTRAWQAGEKLKAYYDLRVPSDTPAGIYSLFVQVGTMRVGITKMTITNFK